MPPLPIPLIIKTTFIIIVTTLLLISESSSSSYLTCPRPEKSHARSAKYLKLVEKVLSHVPCDMKNGGISYCNIPGDYYPWPSVRRFVQENQGLMRRMYGEVRQLNVLRMEFDGGMNSIDTTSANDDDDDDSSSSRRSFVTTEDDSFLKEFVATTTPSYDAEKTIKDNATSDTSSSTTSTTTEMMTEMTTEEEDIMETTTTTIIDSSSSDNSSNSTILFFNDDIDKRNGVEETIRSGSDDDKEKSSIENNNNNNINNSEQLNNSGGQQQQQQLRAVNACPVKEEVVAPYWANNTRGEVLALLNLYPFEQYVHFEKCNYELKQMYCRRGCRCEQQYRLHRLLAFDPTNECRGIFSDWFKFPSCCICKCYMTEAEIASHLFRSTSANNNNDLFEASETNSRVPRHYEKMNSEFNYFDDDEEEDDFPDVGGVASSNRHFYYNQGGGVPR